MVPPKHRRPVRRKPCRWSIAGGVLVFFAPVLVLAFGTVRTSFLNHYSTTTLDTYTMQASGSSCYICHVTSGTSTQGNSYRLDLIAANRDVASLDAVDSDGDGIDNATEATTARVDAPTMIDSVPQVGYNPGLIDCPDGTLGYDPAAMETVSGVNETPPGGTVWSHEIPATNCNDGLDNDCDGLADQDDPDCATWWGATDLGGGWYWLEWFQYFNVNFAPWIYHDQHAWLFPFGTEDPGGIVFYDAGMQQFWWTASVVYPFVYRFSDGVWLFYELGSSNPRWFYNFTTQQWEEH